MHRLTSNSAQPTLSSLLVLCAKMLLPVRCKTFSKIQQSTKIKARSFACTASKGPWYKSPHCPALPITPNSLLTPAHDFMLTLILELTTHTHTCLFVSCRSMIRILFHHAPARLCGLEHQRSPSCENPTTTHFSALNILSRTACEMMFWH
jgi:hypothetical protein